MSHQISGTIYLNESSNNRYQLLYGSFYHKYCIAFFGKNFLGLYGKFNISKGILNEIDLLLINYSNRKKHFINNAYLNLTVTPRSCTEVSTTETPIDINCLTLTVEIFRGEGPMNCSVDGNNTNLINIRSQFTFPQNDLYFEVLREGDEGNKTDLEYPKVLTECIDLEKFGLMYPGKICPRGYSKIII